MKNITLPLLLLAMALPVHADTLGIKLGADVWHLNSKVENNSSSDDTTGSYYVAVEHFFPLVPNLRLRQTNVDTRDLEFKQTDITGYYQMLDNGVMTFDLGLTMSHFGQGQLSNTPQTAQGFDKWHPSLYGNVEIGVPASDFIIFTDLQFSNINNTSVVDGQAGLMYAFATMGSEVRIRGGYRMMDYDFEWVEGNGESESHGWFAGVEFSF
ncbi:TIGR04219 family outer membrane beta-barrel protein [Thaumasiovibrio sp. DFM-14]|uniref:TIGR04219 family outer membrane beta-barrel protein n=1 Tax=Thaumasiovibrio sp. DFM-14 TaxID=3384792 RepID=UPI00399FD7BE